MTKNSHNVAFVRVEWFCGFGGFCKLWCSWKVPGYLLCVLGAQRVTRGLSKGYASIFGSRGAPFPCLARQHASLAPHRPSASHHYFHRWGPTATLHPVKKQCDQISRGLLRWYGANRAECLQRTSLPRTPETLNPMTLSSATAPRRGCILS